MSFFYFKFGLTAIIFSLVIGAFIVRWNKENRYTIGELVLYALGLGPVFTVLSLYYLLLVIPGKPHWFYVCAVLAIYCGLAYAAVPGFTWMYRHAREYLASRWNTYRPLTPGEKIKRGIYPLTVILLLALFLGLYAGNTLQTPIDGHDALVYGNFGKLYAHRSEIRYMKQMTATKSGFVFIGSQKPSFSLLLTWELMLNSRTANTGNDFQFDLFFRSISGYYGLLIVAVVFLWVRRKNKYLALPALLIMVSGLRFVLMIVDYHLDSYRIFFLLVSWVWLGYTIKNKDDLSFVLLGIFSGFAAFSHPIGLLAAVLNLAAFLLFDERPLKTRLLKTVVLALLILACGNIHYPLEIFFGSYSGLVTYI